ncbi:hypothetical protein EMCRGX_G013297 [Ephydatia muelleri]
MLKSMLRKHVAKFGSQWDWYLPGILWAYRNTPHELTKEKPSFFLYGVDCRSPTVAAPLPTEQLGLTEISDYREELVVSLSSARELAVSSIKAAQLRYKQQYDRKSRPVTFKLVKVFFPDDGPIQVHQTRACLCPKQLPARFYWYGGNRKSAGKVPRWVGRLLSQDDVCPDVSNTIDDPDAVREDSATLSEATPSDVLDESHVLDQCSSRMERFQHYLAKNLLFTQPQFYIP